MKNIWRYFIVEILLNISLVLIGLSFIFILVRFILGSTVVDRVVSLDVLTVSSIGLIVILANLFERYIYIDVAFVYGVLSFIGVIVIAKYLEKSL